MKSLRNKMSAEDHGTTQNKKLILQHVPGKGAWTYHLVIPRTKDIRGRWGFMKVSGIIDDYDFKDLNVAPLK
jgi:hypothetical protein